VPECPLQQRKASTRSARCCADHAEPCMHSRLGALATHLQLRLFVHLVREGDMSGQGSLTGGCAAVLRSGCRKSNLQFTWSTPSEQCLAPRLVRPIVRCVGSGNAGSCSLPDLAPHMNTLQRAKNEVLSNGNGINISISIDTSINVSTSISISISIGMQHPRACLLRCGTVPCH
jgi:hypothetical protein